MEVCSRMIKLTLCFCTLVWIIGAEKSSLNQSKKDAELIQRLEQSLLSSFGLEERPKVDKSQVKIPPYMFHLYNQKVKQNLEENEEISQKKNQTKASARYSSSYLLANTVRSIIHSESPKDHHHPSHKMLFHFNTTSIPRRESLQGAELRINHRPHHIYNNISKIVRRSKVKRRRWPKHELVYLTRINVYDVIRPTRGYNDPIHKLLDTRVIDSRMNDTESFDVSDALKRWLSKPHTNYGIYVEVIPLKDSLSSLKNANHVRLRRSTDENADEWNEQQPILIVHTDDEKLKPREKRSAPPPPSAFKRPHCKRYNLHVDFRKVDWDTWIVAPPGYDAFFCQGDCPFPLAKHMNATNHAVIQNIIHSRYPTRVPSACCVPIKHSAISMLYLDRDRKVVLKTYQDMIVESCGCQ